MEFSEQKRNWFFLGPTEGTEVIYNSIDDDVCEAKNKQKGALINVFDSWY